jgi:mRNA interferase MazF
VLIVQSNPFNDSRISTAIVAVITSNPAIADAPGNVRLAKADSGLGKPSVVNVSQVVTVDKAVLTEKLRALPPQLMGRVDEGLRLVLAL